MPDLDPSSRRALPPRLPEVARREGPNKPARPAAPEADPQTRQALAASGDEAETSSSPKLAVGDALSPSPDDAPGRLNPAPAEDAPRPVVEMRRKPAGSPEDNGPPPIEVPQARAPQGPSVRYRVSDPDTGGNPILAGRPRMPGRNDLPPDVPPPAFPRTYYGEKAPAAPKVVADEKTERWTWKPRLIRRLRGE